MRNEIQYPKILTRFFGLEFFIFKIFVDFFDKNRQIFQFMRQTPANMIVKTQNKPFQ